MYDFKNKVVNIRQNNNYLLTKTLSMFEWDGLPETIPSKELEKLLQNNGYAYITKVNGELYAFNGCLGGEVDVYGNPTTIIISNVALNFNKTLNIAEDGVLVLSDDMKMGLLPLFNKHNKDTFAYGYGDIRLNDAKVLKGTIIDKHYNIYEFDTIESELEYVYESIFELLENGIDINNIYIVADNEYENYFKRYNSYYDFKVNYPSDNSLYGTEAAKKLAQEQRAKQMQAAAQRPKIRF